MKDFPSKDRRRAKRRFLKQKMKQKAKRIARAFGWEESGVVKIADNLAFCDSFCCRNPRKTLHEKTLQEKKADEMMKEQVNFVLTS